MPSLARFPGLLLTLQNRVTSVPLIYFRKSRPRRKTCTNHGRARKKKKSTREVRPGRTAGQTARQNDGRTQRRPPKKRQDGGRTQDARPPRGQDGGRTQDRRPPKRAGRRQDARRPPKRQDGGRTAGQRPPKAGRGARQMARQAGRRKQDRR